MKKVITFLLTAAILMVTLTACGNANSNTKPSGDSSAIDTAETVNSTAGADTEKKDSPIKTTDKVGVVFDSKTVTITYSGTPESYFYDSLDKGVYKYMKLYFTYEEDSMDNAGVFQLETNGDGNVSSLLQFDDYKLKGGEVTFGENGFPMTCVFTGTEDEIAGVLSVVDMKGKIKVNDSLYNNYYVDYVKDAVKED